ncbi:MAG: hypothetical protein MUC29_08290 [Pyrinomonadaceae bacterium]|jgi:hypothetical protein|nr:hypothetical protein [Pyrinomonadaceae bacterium]
MNKLLFTILFLSLSFSVFAQNTKKKPTKKPVAKPTPTVTATPIPIPEPTPLKTNQRTETNSNQTEPIKKNNQRPNIKQEPIPVYFYQFSQPDFVISKINLEHDENGKGKITFEKRDFGEPITDPIQLSNNSLEKLKSLFNSLNFLESTEDYQSERHYAHLGVMKLKMRKDGKEREVEFDWTLNKDAKALIDEYRKLSDQFVWMFDMSIARENQPLEAPKLMEAFDGMLKRNDISDPLQMIPLLKELSNDERIPLIARNQATRIIKDIEKKAEKDKK